jgi:hypothetical protein
MGPTTCAPQESIAYLFLVPFLTETTKVAPLDGIPVDSTARLCPSSGVFQAKVVLQVVIIIVQSLSGKIISLELVNGPSAVGQLGNSDVVSVVVTETHTEAGIVIVVKIEAALL